VSKNLAAGLTKKRETAVTMASGTQGWDSGCPIIGQRPRMPDQKAYSEVMASTRTGDR
jgi:hypothetical protein